MNNIVHLKNDFTNTRDQMLQLLEDIRGKVESGKIDQLCIVARQPDDEEERVVIGWSNVNPCDMQVLIGHLQCDVIFECMRQAGY
jgi:hypothetical protein